MGFSPNPAIASPDGDATRTEAVSFVLNPRNALPQIMQFLTLYPTNFTVLDEMLAYSRYRTNPEVICINQDVPTYFYAVQRSRLPMVAMPLGRGLSDTNTGEVNQVYFIKFLKYFARFLHVLLPVLPSGEIGHRTVVNSRAIHLNTSASLRDAARTR